MKKRYLKQEIDLLTHIAKTFNLRLNLVRDYRKVTRIEKEIDNKVRELIYFSGI